MINTVTAPVINIEGGDVVYHEKSIPFHDPGATAQVLLPGHTYMDVPVTTVSNTVPAVCDTLGDYEVQYEAVGPHGLYTIQATRKVIIGQCTCISDLCLVFPFFSLKELL